MKIISSLKLPVLFMGGVSLLASMASADTYSGNGATGFGGQVGGSTLTITNDAANPALIDFSLSTTGFTGNDLAIYIDSTAGGFNSTANFTDTGGSTVDTGRASLSGLSSNGRTLAQFPAGFNADFGISLEPGSFAGLFSLAANASFGFVASGGLDTSATTTLNFSFNRSDLGLPATGGSFTFVGTLLSGGQYRSNETIGGSTTVPGTAGDTPNAGFTGTTTFTSVDTFAVPEPSTWAMMLGGLGLLGGAQYFRRVRRA